MLIWAVTTTTTISVCPQCGTVQRSGKSSCCGRGGSWFGQCGNAGNKHFGHTWYEGIRVCNVRQTQVAAQQQLEAFQPDRNASSYNGSSHMNSQVAIAATHKFLFKTANTSTATFTVFPTITQSPVSVSTGLPLQTSAHSSSAARECVQLLSCFALALIIVYWQ